MREREGTVRGGREPDHALNRLVGLPARERFAGAFPGVGDAFTPGFQEPRFPVPAASEKVKRRSEHIQIRNFVAQPPAAVMTLMRL